MSDSLVLLEHSTPKVFFTVPGLAQDGYYHAYDVHPDGKRFRMVTSGGVDAPGLDAIFNWRAELEKIKASGVR